MRLELDARLVVDCLGLRLRKRLCVIEVDRINLPLFHFRRRSRGRTKSRVIVSFRKELLRRIGVGRLLLGEHRSASDQSDVGEDTRLHASVFVLFSGGEIPNERCRRLLQKMNKEGGKLRSECMFGPSSQTPTVSRSLMHSSAYPLVIATSRITCGIEHGSNCWCTPNTT